MPRPSIIFKLCLYGDGTSGALGVNEVVKWLNSHVTVPVLCRPVPGKITHS
jgi:hypothetical protein